jgi:hypothetical protein
MYKILGGDGKEYGPVTAEALRQWVNEGRASGQTQVCAEGTTEWQPLAALPEFAQLFAAPPLGKTSAVGGLPVGPAPTSGMAITSLVLGITGVFCGITAIPGLILGIVSMKKIKASQGRIGGQGLALAGTIVSGAVLALMLLLIPIYAAMLLPALAKAKSKAQTINCVNNLKQLGLSVRMYSGDKNDTYPAATNWCDTILTYAGTTRIFQCPGDAAQVRSSYAFNAALSGMTEAEISPDTVLIFECDSGWNASGGKELMIKSSRHNKMYVVALADGSVQQIPEARLPQLRWNPRNETNNPQK